MKKNIIVIGILCIAIQIGFIIMPPPVMGQSLEYDKSPHGAVFLEGYGLGTIVSGNISFAPTTFFNGKFFPEVRIGYGHRRTPDIRSNMYFPSLSLVFGKEPYFIECGLSVIFEETIYRQIQNDNWLSIGFDIWKPTWNIGFRRYFYSKPGLYLKASVYLMADRRGPFEYVVFSPFPEIHSGNRVLVWWGFSAGLSF